MQLFTQGQMAEKLGYSAKSASDVIPPLVIGGVVKEKWASKNWGYGPHFQNFYSCDVEGVKSALDNARKLRKQGFLDVGGELVLLVKGQKRNLELKKWGQEEGKVALVSSKQITSRISNGALRTGIKRSAIELLRVYGAGYKCNAVLLGQVTRFCRELKTARRPDEEFMNLTQLCSLVGATGERGMREVSEQSKLWTEMGLLATEERLCTNNRPCAVFKSASFGQLWTVPLPLADLKKWIRGGDTCRVIIEKLFEKGIGDTRRQRALREVKAIVKRRGRRPAIYVFGKRKRNKQSRTPEEFTHWLRKALLQKPLNARDVRAKAEREGVCMGGVRKYAFSKLACKRFFHLRRDRGKNNGLFVWWYLPDQVPPTEEEAKLWVGQQELEVPAKKDRSAHSREASDTRRGDYKQKRNAKIVRLVEKVRQEDETLTLKEAFAEIGAIMGMKPATVKTIFNRKASK